LGQSLGINNIPAKVCSYDCLYCQIGPTAQFRSHPRAFFAPEKIHAQVSRKVSRARAHQESIDYLTFVSDGEPTLDLNLGRSILALKPLGIKLAVISNGSLLEDPNIRRSLGTADWVSLKVDVFQEKIWYRLNRPHESLRWNAVLDGMLDFARYFKGRLATETMLVQGVNDDPAHLRQVAQFVSLLNPDTAYLAIPTRPPGREGICAPPEAILNEAYQIFDRKIAKVELLIGDEGDAFAFTGDVAEDVLSITAVHPMAEDALRGLLGKAHADWDVIQKMIEAGRIIKLRHNGKSFYMRRIKSRVQEHREG
jgi:wyosine [tRNA(Phe)-imidazoG37] synthetase (radical SAM superfamily)